MTDHKASVTYEVTYIIKPTLDEESADKVVTLVEEYIKGQGGAVQAIDKKGRRRLTYEVKKMKDGYFVTTVFAISPEVVSNVKRMMNLSEDIIRSLIVVYIPEEAAAPSTSYR